MHFPPIFVEHTKVTFRGISPCQTDWADYTKRVFFSKESLMNLQVPAQEISEPITKPVVEPSIPHPHPDPLREAEEVVEAIRHDSTQEPGDYLDEIRCVLGAE